MEDLAQYLEPPQGMCGSVRTGGVSVRKCGCLTGCIHGHLNQKPGHFVRVARITFMAPALTRCLAKVQVPSEPALPCSWLIIILHFAGILGV